MIRMRWMMLALLAGAPVGSRTAAAQADTGTAVLRDFRFASSEVLPEVRIFYRTAGRVRRAPGGRALNAVLLLHGTAGSGQGFLAPTFAGELFGPGQPLDTARYFVIIPDNLGHGRSTKPSDGLRARFPAYGYEDMTNAQYRLVTERLGLDRLHVVMGTSMGCMHAWVWGTRWPAMMDGLVPLACLPAAITGRNRMWRRLVVDGIRSDSAWQGGAYTQQPPGLRAAIHLIWYVGTAPLLEQQRGPTRDSADAYITRWMTGRLGTTDANDLMYAVGASRDYDPAPLLDRVQVPVLAINSADDEINPPELGVMERLLPRVPHARFVLIPVGPQSRGHGSHSWPPLWKGELAAFLAALRPEREE
jgi:homoserine O-acetyltransferase